MSSARAESARAGTEMSDLVQEKVLEGPDVPASAVATALEE
jgi:hypothetical protein